MSTTFLHGITFRVYFVFSKVDGTANVVLNGLRIVTETLTLSTRTTFIKQKRTNRRLGALVCLQQTTHLYNKMSNL